VISGLPEKGPPVMVQLPTAMTTLRSAMASYVYNRAVFIFLDAGPVTTMPSAWRGDAIKLMPKRARSKKDFNPGIFYFSFRQKLVVAVSPFIPRRRSPVF